MTQVAYNKPGVDIGVQLPAAPIGWRILIRPYRPEVKTEGGIYLPDEALDNEEILTYCGQIVAMGNKCYTAVTRAGIDMSQVDPKPKVGDWVIYGTHGGQKLRMKGGGMYIVVNDDSISCVVNDPREFQYYL